jgi:hypothetical protein
MSPLRILGIAATDVNRNPLILPGGLDAPAVGTLAPRRRPRPVSVGVTHQRGIRRRNSVSLENADEQPVGGRRAVAVMRNASRHHRGARNVCVDQRLRRTCRLGPMDVPEIAQPHFSALPSVPFTVNSNQQFVIGFHVFLCLPAMSGTKRQRRSWNHPVDGGETRRQEMSPFRTAYRTISAVLCRFSFCMRLARWVSTVDTPRSSSVATSLFDRPSARRWRTSLSRSVSR